MFYIYDMKSDKDGVKSSSGIFREIKFSHLIIEGFLEWFW